MLTVTRSTWLKQSTAQAATLPDSAKTPIAPGKWEAIDVTPTVAGHWKVAFATPKLAADGIKKYQSWVIWGEDIERPVISRKNGIKLAVPFFKQTDNIYEPDRTCNTSSCAMVAKFLGAKISGDDEYYSILRQFGDTTDHGAQTKALERIGIVSQWRTDLGFSDLDRSLKAGLPIVIGILHRGPTSDPRGGHMLVVGGEAGEDYVCFDPYGSLLDSYSASVDNGNGVVYPRSELEARWTVGGGGGWGRTFYGNKS